MSRKITLSLVGLFLISLTLNCIGLNWGLPAGQSWQPDSIAGMRTISFTPDLFKQWRYKYPRAQFLINAAVYKPYLDHWKENPITAQGKRYVLNEQRISTLIRISRIISALMGAGAVIAVFLTAKLLFSDWLAGLLAGLSLAFTQHFVFYSHLGNVDMPTTFWFAWSLYWAVKAVYIGKWRHYLLLGLFIAIAVCTKDPTAGYAIGLALAVWIAVVGKAKTAGKTFKESVAAIFNYQTLAAFLAAVFVFALLNDLLTAPQGFFKRMGHWIGGPGTANYNVYFAGHLHLLWNTCRNLYYVMGWPLLAATIASVIYCILKFRSKSAFAIVPFIVFYLVVIVNIRFSYYRFLLPALPALFLLTGKGCADLLRWKKLPVFLRATPIAVVFILSFLYAVGLDLELLSDTRYQAEEWFEKNVDRKNHITALSGVNYAPRLRLYGFSYSIRWDNPQNQSLLERQPAYPPYIIMSEKAYKRDSFDINFRHALFDGSLGYKQVAVFENKYLYPQKTIFGVAGWPMERYSMFSPEIIVLKK